MAAVPETGFNEGDEEPKGVPGLRRGEVTGLVGFDVGLPLPPLPTTIRGVEVEADADSDDTEELLVEGFAVTRSDGERTMVDLDVAFPEEVVDVVDVVVVDADALAVCPRGGGRKTSSLGKAN